MNKFFIRTTITGICFFIIFLVIFSVKLVLNNIWDEKYSTANLSVKNDMIIVEKTKFLYDFKDNFKKTNKELTAINKNLIGNIKITSDNIVKISNKNYKGVFSGEEYILIIQFKNYQEAKEFLDKLYQVSN